MVAFSPGAAVEDLSESLGVPHTEMDLVMRHLRLAGWRH